MTKVWLATFEVTEDDYHAMTIVGAFTTPDLAMMACAEDCDATEERRRSRQPRGRAVELDAWTGDDDQGWWASRTGVFAVRGDYNVYQVEIDQRRDFQSWPL